MRNWLNDKHPRSGPLYDSGIACQMACGVFQSRAFENYLIFYRPRENGIELIRVLHGARDLATLFAEEET